MKRQLVALVYYSFLWIGIHIHSLKLSFLTKSLLQPTISSYPVPDSMYYINIMHKASRSTSALQIFPFASLESKTLLSIARQLLVKNDFERMVEIMKIYIEMESVEETSVLGYFSAAFRGLTPNRVCTKGPKLMNQMTPILDALNDENISFMVYIQYAIACLESCDSIPEVKMSSDRLQSDRIPSHYEYLEIMMKNSLWSHITSLGKYDNMWENMKPLPVRSSNCHYQKNTHNFLQALAILDCFGKDMRSNMLVCSFLQAYKNKFATDGINSTKSLDQHNKRLFLLRDSISSFYVDARRTLPSLYKFSADLLNEYFSISDQSSRYSEYDLEKGNENNETKHYSEVCTYTLCRYYHVDIYFTIM